MVQAPKTDPLASGRLSAGAHVLAESAAGARSRGQGHHQLSHRQDQDHVLGQRLRLLPALLRLEQGSVTAAALGQLNQAERDRDRQE